MGDESTFKAGSTTPKHRTNDEELIQSPPDHDQYFADSMLQGPKPGAAPPKKKIPKKYLNRVGKKGGAGWDPTAEHGGLGPFPVTIAGKVANTGTVLEGGSKGVSLWGGNATKSR